MKGFLVAFTIFFVWSIVGIWIFNMLMTHNTIQTVTSESETPLVSNQTSNVINEPGTNSLDSDIKGKFIIKKWETKIREVNSKDFKNKLHTYLINNPDKFITIQGIYKKTEPYTLAERRAEYLKSIFVIHGVDSSRIKVKTKEGAFEYNKKEEYDNGFLIHIDTIPKKIKKVVNNNISRKVLFAKFASNTFEPDNAFKTYVDSLRVFITGNPEKNIAITGHTDDIGNEADNEWVGLQRAKSVALYLVEQGIPKDNITVRSAGETEPIGDNNTTQGRQKNRRIVITMN